MEPAARLTITKTFKLFIGGAFPRSESGRTTPVLDREGHVHAHVARASRKDLRDAVEAAERALAAWSGATPYLRGQVLYRLAEMMEGKAGELAAALAIDAPATGAESRGALDPRAEVAAAIDRVVHYAGWCDKLAQVLGGANPVAGPYHNFTIPEPVGVAAVVCPDDAPLLALVSLVAPVLCAGNAVISLASASRPLAACVLGEAIATSDLPAGAWNVLTGDRGELTPHIASHREILAVHAANLNPDQAALLHSGVSENLKRVRIREVTDWLDGASESPWWIEPFVEMKTIWHPSGA